LAFRFPSLLSLCGFGGVASIRFSVALARRSVSASEYWSSVMVEHASPNQPDKLMEVYNDFHFQYGVTLSRWAGLEETLCTIFCDLCGLHPDEPMGKALFYSGRSFTARADLLSAAIRTCALGEPEKALLRAILKRARQYSTARNAIAHGVPTHFSRKRFAYQGWRIKEPEQTWELGGIGIDQLKEAEMNFLGLSIICHEANMDALRPPRRWRRKKRLKPTEWYLEQVQELPNSAYPPEEAPIPIEP
jgi:hypothetical protein